MSDLIIARKPKVLLRSDVRGRELFPPMMRDEDLGLLNHRGLRRFKRDKQNLWRMPNFVDLTITAASVLKSSGGSINTTNVAAVTVTQGQAVYLNASSKWALAQGTTSVLSGFGATYGVALTAASVNQPLVVFVPTPGTSCQINLGATLVVDTVYVVSKAVAGNISPQADLVSGNFLTVLGVAVTAALLEMSVSLATGVAVP